MDTRLFNIRGRRPGLLRQQDLDQLARMIVAVLRKRGTAGVGVFNGAEVAILSDTEGGVAVILKEDWARILPYIQDGTFSPLLFPVATNESAVDPIGEGIRKRVLSVLQGLFPLAYPTSNL